MAELVNRVAQSGIITIDLEEFYPTQEIAEIDIKDWLFMGMVVKEKDFREKAETYDWAQYKDKLVGIYCSADAIVPLWAYMIIASHIEGVAAYFISGTKAELLSNYFQKKLNEITPADYAGRRVVIKGCGDKEIPASAYVDAIRLLQPYAKSIMYGEPCSTVPVYKKVG